MQIGLPLYWDREIQFYITTGTEKYSFTPLQGQKNTAVQFHWHGEKIEKKTMYQTSHIIKHPIY